MKILMRGTVNPLTAPNTAKFIIENRTGGNICNMLFTHSVAEALMYSDDVEIDYVNTAKKKLDRYYADYVNDTYDCFVLPLANTFKVQGHEEMVSLADFIKMLKIPCHIIGVGIQRTLTGDKFIDTYPYNDEVKQFVSAVLNKSPLIGVKGEITSDYLSDLGFKPEKDFTVIGCPSMYLYGEKLPKVKALKLNGDSVVAFNSKVEFETRKGYAPVIDFLKSNMAEFKNPVYVAQQIDDIRMLYLDRYKRKRRDNKFYDIDKAVSFVDIHSWIDFFKDVNLSVGSRIHGNIAAVLAGTPALAIPYDRRVYEIADYHNIPIIDYKALDGASLTDIAEKTDFTTVNRGHGERFSHYLDFLHKLGLDTIYDHSYADGTPYDKLIAEQEFCGVIKAYGACGEAEQLERYRDAFPIVKKLQSDESIRGEELSAEIEELKAEIAQLKNPPKKKRGLFKKKNTDEE
ncbi:MAG: polysaccharide pyruvyl transferase family protein [Eubacterium sp.]|nr:polysaccharide pyruvyl transferase family protein [Eubacterium sp.]